MEAEAGRWGRAVVMVLWGEQSIRVRASPNLLSTLDPLTSLGVEAALSVLQMKPPSLTETRSFMHGRTARLDIAGIWTSVLWFHAAVFPLRASRNSHSADLGKASITVSRTALLSGLKARQSRCPGTT